MLRVLRLWIVDIKEQENKERRNEGTKAAEPVLRRLGRSLRLHRVFYVIVVLGVAADIGTKKLSFAVVDPPRGLYVFREVNGKKIMVPARGDEPDRFPSISSRVGEERITRTVIPGFLNVRCSFNPGAMFGIFPNREVFLIIFTTVAVAIILGIVHQVLKPTQLAMHLALGFICAGALGNLWDRFHFHAVRDFLDFHAGFWPALAGWLESIKWIGQSHWPTFNVADIFICVGVALVFIKQVIGHEGQKLAKPASGADDSCETVPYAKLFGNGFDPAVGAQERPVVVEPVAASDADDSHETVPYAELYGNGFDPAAGAQEQPVAVEPVSASDADDSCDTVEYSELFGNGFDPAAGASEPPEAREDASEVPDTFPRVLKSPGDSGPEPTGDSDKNGAPPEAQP